MDKSTSLAKFNEKDIQRLDEFAEQGELAMTAGSGSFADTFRIAAAMNNLRVAITDGMMDDIMALSNTRLGFQTDRDPNKTDKNGRPMIPYSRQAVKDCIIEAVMNGLRVVGNEFNIISGNTYATLGGYSGKLKRLKGLSKLNKVISVPRISTNGAVVDCEAAWIYNGREDSLKVSIPVRTDSYSTADSIIGKATRKFLKRVWEQITGVSTPDGSVDDGVVDVGGSTSGPVQPSFGPTATQQLDEPHDDIQTGGSDFEPVIKPKEEPKDDPKEEPKAQPAQEVYDPFKAPQKPKVPKNQVVDVPFTESKPKTPQPPAPTKAENPPAQPEAAKQEQVQTPPDLTTEQAELVTEFEMACQLKSLKPIDVIRWCQDQEYIAADIKNHVELITKLPKRARSLVSQMTSIAAEMKK